MPIRQEEAHAFSRWAVVDGGAAAADAVVAPTDWLADSFS